MGGRGSDGFPSLFSPSLCVSSKRGCSNKRMLFLLGEMWRMEMDEADFPGGCAVVLFRIKTGYILLSFMFVGQLET